MTRGVEVGTDRAVEVLREEGGGGGGGGVSATLVSLAVVWVTTVLAVP